MNFHNFQAIILESGVKTESRCDLFPDLARFSLQFYRLTLTSFLIRLRSECAAPPEM